MNQMQKINKTKLVMLTRCLCPEYSMIQDIEGMVATFFLDKKCYERNAKNKQNQSSNV
jgi:hypothetical protein